MAGVGPGLNIDPPSAAADGNVTLLPSPPGSAAPGGPLATAPAPTTDPAAADIAPLAPAAADPQADEAQTELMQSVQELLAAGKLAQALRELTKVYTQPDVPDAQWRQATELLDQLAGTVIYSREHYLEPPYVVKPGDTLDIVAAQYSVPPVLLQRINGIADPQRLAPNQQLKVVRGPFHALVSLERHEVTLFADGCYAGRFAIGTGVDCPKQGEFTVLEKSENRAYQGPDGTSFPPGDRRNPLGRLWIGLSDRVGLHGVNDPQNVGRDDNLGAIGLSDRDIDDLYGILSVGSRVVIRR